MALFFGAVLIAAPAIVGAKGPLSFDPAFAGPGKSGDHGGGKGKSGDHGKVSGKDKKAAAAEEDEEEEEEELLNKKGKLASKLGALNAYHASPNAFKNASPNSRVGRIAAYWNALEAAEADGQVTAEEQAELDKLLDDAANKPIDAETREAFNNLLREKFGDDGEEETQ
ncbi:MAG: hypothetical protein ACT4SY_01990 [Hyphomicrobiales bacterium]